MLPFVLNSFKNFDLEDSQKCAVDWLMIGPSSKREEYKVCGSSIPPSFISARDHVWIFFHSDASSSGQAQGFRLSYIRGRIFPLFVGLPFILPLAKLGRQQCFFLTGFLQPLMTVKYWCGNTNIICMWLFNSIADVYWPD